MNRLTRAVQGTALDYFVKQIFDRFEIPRKMFRRVVYQDSVFRVRNTYYSGKVLGALTLPTYCRYQILLLYKRCYIGRITYWKLILKCVASNEYEGFDYEKLSYKYIDDVKYFEENITGSLIDKRHKDKLARKQAREDNRIRRIPL